MKRILTIVLLIGLLSCHKLHNGNIVEKDYHPSFYTFILIPISTGKSTIFISQPVYYPESWSIDVKGEVNKEIRTETYYVSNSEYNSLNIGDFICVDGKCNERKYEKK